MKHQIKYYCNNIFYVQSSFIIQHKWLQRSRARSTAARLCFVWALQVHWRQDSPRSRPPRCTASLQICRTVLKQNTRLATRTAHPNNPRGKLPFATFQNIRLHDMTINSPAKRFLNISYQRKTKVSFHIMVLTIQFYCPVRVSKGVLWYATVCAESVSPNFLYLQPHIHLVASLYGGDLEPLVRYKVRAITVLYYEVSNLINKEH